MFVCLFLLVSESARLQSDSGLMFPLGHCVFLFVNGSTSCLCVSVPVCMCVRVNVCVTKSLSLCMYGSLCFCGSVFAHIGL